MAVSGGVDSVVLLHILTSNYGLPQTGYQFVVAHFDHGIRPDSVADSEFVKELASKYKIPFESAQGNLGPKVSEAKARASRYSFLNQIKKKYKADAIITAHHEDDLLETVLLNLLRGTYRKGLSSLSSHHGLIRPLLGSSKSEIVAYARKHKLRWREDVSNTDETYLRNYIRHTLIPKMLSADEQSKRKLLDISISASKQNAQIDQLIQGMIDDKINFFATKARIPRNWLIMLPNSIGKEVLIRVLRQQQAFVELNTRLINKYLLFAKTGKIGKKLELSNRTTMVIQAGYVLVATKTKR